MKTLDTAVFVTKDKTNDIRIYVLQIDNQATYNEAVEILHQNTTFHSDEEIIKISRCAVDKKNVCVNYVSIFDFETNGGRTK